MSETLREAVERLRAEMVGMQAAGASLVARSWVVRRIDNILAEHTTTPAEKDWGVRFPNGAVQSYGANEAEARRFALATTALRPDLPTLVVRQVVTPWEVPA